MDQVEFQWLKDAPSLKEALQLTLGCSGQLLKKHFSSRDLGRPQKTKEVVRLPLGLVNHLQINPTYEGPESRIIHETADYIALHKPPGIHSHPLCYEDQNTLLNYLAQIGKWDPLKVNALSYDRGLLYRLDFETSGILILAKNEDFFIQFRSNFQQEMKGKFYWAIVEGDFSKVGKWTHYFKATGQKGSKQGVSSGPHPEAVPGVLRVEKILYQDGKSLLLIDLKSGLRHQIRAQLAALGFPLLGDELYGGSKAARLFLHAFRYEWKQGALEDNAPELFGSFFNLDRALQVGHDVIRRLQG
jgi:23S rRNA pseudouridine1911/1915/1917 synthase